MGKESCPVLNRVGLNLFWSSQLNDINFFFFYFWIFLNCFFLFFFFNLNKNFFLFFNYLKRNIFFLKKKKNVKYKMFFICGSLFLLKKNKWLIIIFNVFLKNFFLSIFFNFLYYLNYNIKNKFFFL